MERNIHDQNVEPIPEHEPSQLVLVCGTLLPIPPNASLLLYQYQHVGIQKGSGTQRESQSLFLGIAQTK